MEVKTYESKTAAERVENVNAAVNDGANIVVMLGFEFNDIVKEVAPTAPDTQFLIVDQCIENQPDNVHCAVFREYEASYLMGVAAGMLTKTNKVGVVGALDIPFLHRYTDGYAQGVKSVKPDAKVEVRWVGGDNPFADPVRAKEQAVAMNAAGADYIYTATSGGDFGVFEAAKEKDFKVFSVDVNHCPDIPGLIVDQSLKQVDVALGSAVDAILGGQKKVFMALGIKEGAVGAIALERSGHRRQQMPDRRPSGRRGQDARSCGNDRRRLAEARRSDDGEVGRRAACMHACPSRHNGSVRAARCRRRRVDRYRRRQGACRRRRERRRQVDPDECAVRPEPARSRADRSRWQGAPLGVAAGRDPRRARHGAPALHAAGTDDGAGEHRALRRAGEHGSASSISRRRAASSREGFQEHGIVIDLDARVGQPLRRAEAGGRDPQDALPRCVGC